MKVIAKDNGFYKGSRVRAGEIFEFDGEKCGKWFVPYGKPQAVKADESDDKGPTLKEIKAQLDLAGVKYDARANKPELLELLKETVEKFSPGASTKLEDLTEKTE